jgi:hypothetical protein
MVSWSQFPHLLLLLQDRFHKQVIEEKNDMELSFL